MRLEKVSDHYRLCFIIDDLFDKTKVISDIKIGIPNADYQGLLKTLNENEDFFKERNIKWEIIHKDSGFVLRIDMVNGLSGRF